MSKRRIVAWSVIAASVAIAASWWPWSAASPGIPAVTARTTQSERADRDAAPLPSERTAASSLAGVPFDDAAEPANVANADRWILVHAVLDDGRPAAGARVDVAQLRRNDYDAWIRSLQFEGDSKPPAQASFTTDANGGVRLPWHHDEIGDVPITVVHGVAFATTTINTTAQPGSTHEVRLAIDQSLQVRVVDANGRPAPKVFVGTRATLRGADGRDRPAQLLAKALSGGDGTATFAHVQTWRERITPQPARTFEVYAWLPGGDVFATVDAAGLPREPLVLTIPPAGTIEVAAMEADGTTLTREMIGLAAADTDNVTVVPITAAVTTIVHVPLGRKWRAWIPARCDGVEFDGPRTAGEVVNVTLRARPCPMVVGRLWRNGSPLADTPISSLDGLDTIWTPVTDGDGRFRLAANAPYERVQRISVVVTDEQRAIWRATWRGDLELTPTIHDLGDLQLERVERGPLMVSGRVVAPGGLDSVRLRVIIAHDEPHSMSPEITQKPDGTFAVYGADPGGELKLAVSSSNHVSEPVIPFQYGQRDVLVTLRAGVRLVVPLAVTSRPLAECLAIGIEPLPIDTREDRAFSAPTLRQSYFEGGAVECAWDALEPGSYRLTVRLGRGGKALVSADVELPADASEVRAPRIDVPDARVVRLRLPRPLHSDRQSEPYTSVRRLVDDDTEEVGVEEAPDLWIVATQEPIDLRVHVPGYRARVLRGVFADTTVALDPAIPTDLIVDAPAMREGADVWVTLFGGEAMLLVTLTGGRARLLLPDAGEYSIEVSVRGAAAMEDWRFEPDSITVPEHGGTFTVRASPTPK